MEVSFFVVPTPTERRWLGLLVAPLVPSTKYLYVGAPGFCTNLQYALQSCKVINCLH